MDFTGKIIIVTGSSSGIGAVSAIHFAELGASLTFVGRSGAKLQEAAEKIQTINGIAPLIVQADMTNEEDVKRIVHETLIKYSKIDILVINAGILETGTIENTSMEQYDRVMNTNIRAVYQLTILVVPELVKTKGCIVNAAVDQFTRCVAQELAPKGVRCNSVNLDVIVTEIHKRAGMKDEAYTKFLEHCKTTHALGRPGQVNEVSCVIAFLASEKASFIAGASVPVGGGRHAMYPR